ncbi:hypothetical protein [Niabella ginsenosidivorans]|nr:hypothetical protein [Niabella ginsenosidivorans]
MNAVTTPVQNTIFNEEEWLLLLFLLADIQSWLQQLQEGLIYQLPVKHRKKLLRKSGYLSVKALAHILERHYYKPPCHPPVGAQASLASKFTLPIPQIVACIRDACRQPAAPGGQAHAGNRCHVYDAGITIGYNSRGLPVSSITVITDAAGTIVTAFPGAMPP